MEQAGALCGNGIQSKLGSHDACEIADFQGVVQYVLAVAGAIQQAAEGVYQLRVQIVDAGIEGCLLAGLTYLLGNIGFGFLEHFLDAGGMDSTVGNEVFHGDTADFAAYRVEAADGNALGGVIDDQIGAGELFEGADVASFAADNAALQVVGRNLDGGYRDLCGMICCDALNRKGEDLACILVGFGLGTKFGLADNRCRFVGYLVLQGAQQLGLRLFGSKACDLFELLIDFVVAGFNRFLGLAQALFAFLQVAITLVDLTLHAGKLVLAVVEHLPAMIQVLLALVQSFFICANFLQALLALFFDGLAHLEGLVLCLDSCLMLDGFGLKLGGVDKRLSFLFFLLVSLLS